MLDGGHFGRGRPLVEAWNQGRRRLRRLAPPAVVIASVLLFLTSLLWAVVSPDFRTPDEVAHLNSVIRVAEGGGWPRPGDARMRDEAYDAARLACANPVYQCVSTTPPAPRLFTDVPPTPIGERWSFHALEDGRLLPVHDQMTQHPPAYYYAAAAVYKLFDAGDRRFDRAIFLLRAFTALTIALTLPVCCFVAARALTGRESVGKIAAFFPLLIPELHFIGGAVTNDGFSIASAAVVWAAAITIMASGPSRTRLVVLSLALGLACFSKGTSLSVLPIVPVALAIGYRRRRTGPDRAWVRPWLVATMGTLTVAFVLGGWWWAVNLVRYGTLQPGGYALPHRPGVAASPFQYLPTFLRRLRWSFFAEGSVKQPPSFALLTIVLAAVILGLLVLGLLAQRAHLAERLVMGLGIVIPFATLFDLAYSSYRITKMPLAIQGRYLFVLLVPIFVLATQGLVRLAGVMRVRPQHLILGVAPVALGVAVLGVCLAFRVDYLAPGGSWGDALDRFLGWAPWPPVVILGLVVLLLLTGFVLCWHLARTTVHGSDAGHGPSGPMAPLTVDGAAASEDETFRASGAVPRRDRRDTPVSTLVRGVAVVP